MKPKTYPPAYNGKHPGGRPCKVKPKELAKELIAYIQDPATVVPILAEFTVSKLITREYIYELAQNCEELSYAIGLCHCQREVGLEKETRAGRCPAAFGVFALKNMGWKDKSEVKHEGIPPPPSTIDVRIIDSVQPEIPPMEAKND